MFILYSFAIWKGLLGLTVRDGFYFLFLHGLGENAFQGIAAVLWTVTSGKERLTEKGFQFWEPLYLPAKAATFNCSLFLHLLCQLKYNP